MKLLHLAIIDIFCRILVDQLDLVLDAEIKVRVVVVLT